MQLICEEIEQPKLEEVLSLDDTERGHKDFSSTGGISRCVNNNESNELLFEIDEFLAGS